MTPQEFQARIARNESFILANDGQYLGKLSLNKYDTDSVSNPYGNYGSKYSSSSILNKYSNYGSAYSSLSPFNKYSNTPPVIYLRGVKYGFLTKNPYVGGVRLDPEELTSWLQHNNLSY